MSISRNFCLLLIGTVLCGGCQRSAPVDPRLQGPIELEADANTRGLKNVFANTRAQAVLRGHLAALAPAGADDAAAANSPSIWRRLDRAKRFDAVLLAGPSGEFLPLLTHLASSPDFRLVRVDNWGALFVRDLAVPYAPRDPKSVASDLHPQNMRGIYLSQMALTLDAVGLVPATRKYLAAALDYAPNESLVHVNAAAVLLHEKEYTGALREAERALELHPHDLGALEIEARTLAAAGAPDQAWAVANEWKSRAPADDMNVLFFHARLANTAHAYGAEQDSLERLIKLAEKQNLPAGDYRVYLGQCYAKQGLARPALEQLELAAKEPNLTEKEKADLATAIETVRSHTSGMSN